MTSRRVNTRALAALAMLALLTSGLTTAVGAHPSAGSAASDQPQVYQPSGHGTALAHGVVDLSKLPTITPHASASAQTPPPILTDPLTPSQRKAYDDRMRQHPSASAPGALPPQQLTTPAAANVSPNFVGGGAVPLPVKQFDGLDYTQAGSGWGTTAIATDLSYVMEGTTNAIAIYSAASGAKLYGPYSAQSFFAPVYHNGDFFLYPQMYYDTMRDRWIVANLEVANWSDSYLDVAVSQTTSPTQPSPGAKYNVYQFSTHFRSNDPYDLCYRMTLGVDYWGLYLACADTDTITDLLPIGNTVLAIDKAPLLNGTAPKTYWWNDKVTIANGVDPAKYLSPAIEEGVQDGEFVVGIDMGFVSASSSNLTVCAVTNQSTIATTAPLFSCQHANLGYTYTDPITPQQPGGTVALTFPGLKQVYYKAGHLFLAWTSAMNGHDVIDYAEIRPILGQKIPPPPPTGPLLMYGVEVMAAGTGSGLSLPNEDLYDPAIVGTDEDDIVLVYNSSGPSTYPSVNYTGRKASDVSHLMGQGTSRRVILGSYATATTWGEYAACAISLNSVTRGTVWCASEYSGPVGNPHWNTRLVNLRAGVG